MVVGNTSALRMLLPGGVGIARRLLSADLSATSTLTVEERPIKRIGRALETYMKLCKEHTSMMARERADFELGRRHLANIMNMDAHTMTQEDIDEAIKYLFPSSLFDLKARPVMRPPDEILPKFRQLSFDDEGRPKDSRFYTLLPTFYGLLSDIGIKTKTVTSFYNDHFVAGKSTESESVNISGTQWLSREKVEKKLGEKISEELYTHLLMAFDYLVSLPCSAVEEKFIMQYREPLTASTKSKLFGPPIPEVTICPITQRRNTTVRTRCKDTVAQVQVLDAGVGKFDVNGQGLHEFRHLIAREILLAPMIVAGVLGQVDVIATTTGSGGMTALPRAVRHGIALGIAALYPETMEPLRISGLLTSDPRKKERSKVNQPGARAKWIWKRR
ncbi:hypothetical protein KIN20_026151 [Parelaphostrongylus tenuis]|uniref:Ribosomal protein S9 n=1 Tax=Parelaphostrongylus tenuis TaxID=148309 RepID=A0AAD5MWB2_PARTN|nr:hypothetical protein KIN20_026151 [Parelaphostrongylus tenuis]